MTIKILGVKPQSEAKEPDSTLTIEKMREVQKKMEQEYKEYQETAHLKLCPIPPMDYEIVMNWDYSMGDHVVVIDGKAMLEDGTKSGEIKLPDQYTTPLIDLKGVDLPIPKQQDLPGLSTSQIGVSTDPTSKVQMNLESTEEKMQTNSNTATSDVQLNSNLKKLKEELEASRMGTSEKSALNFLQMVYDIVSQLTEKVNTLQEKEASKGGCTGNCHPCQPEA